MRRVLARTLGLAAGLGAAALTVARLSGSTWRPAVVLQAFAPWAIPAYAVLGLLLVVLVVRGDRRWGVALVVAVAGLALHVWWVAPLFVGTAPTAAPGGVRLTVMTSNIEYGHGDVSVIADAVRDHDVDLLAVEEITPDALRRLERTGALAGLPYRLGGTDRTLHGTMVFSRTPVTDVRRVPTGMQSWAFTVDGWRVLAVHPSAPTVARWADDERVLRRTAQAEHPDLMLGDFNATLDHAPLRRLLDTGLRDAAEVSDAGWQPTWPVGGFAGLPFAAAAIDHVLVGPDLTALSTSTVTVPDTDHKSLVAVVAAGS